MVFFDGRPSIQACGLVLRADWKVCERKTVNEKKEEKEGTPRMSSRCFSNTDGRVDGRMVPSVGR